MISKYPLLVSVLREDDREVKNYHTRESGIIFFLVGKVELFLP